jgi:FtsP/CotA-like multicopper oxidase with cupredoxin domain
VELRNLGVANSVDYDHTNKIMAFDVVSGPTSTAGNTVPTQLDPQNAVMALTPGMAKRTRKLRVKRDGDVWEIGEMTWQDVVDSGFTRTLANPALNDVEIWEIENSSGGWFHPVHIHLVDFKILSRNGRPPRPEEMGPKDTVYVGESETVRLIMRFEHQTGRYMMHCHNLPHEDHDMMTQFAVGTGGPDPISAAPARPLPAPPLRPW